MISSFLFYLAESLILSAAIFLLMKPIFGILIRLKPRSRARTLPLFVAIWLTTFTITAVFSEWLGPDFTGVYHFVAWLTPFSVAALICGYRHPIKPQQDDTTLHGNSKS